MVQRTPERWSWSRRLLALWLALLLLSHGVRRLRPEPAAPAGVPSVLLHEQRGDSPPGPLRVRLVYEDTSPPAARGWPLLLLHGSPGSRADLAGLAQALTTRRTLRVDLPGFGDSTRDLPDTSIQAHARYLREWLDQLGIERVHVLGFSMGSGVALLLGQLAPERVASLTLLSGIGVQELELFGEHDLNHALHGLQLAAFWLVDVLLPHFGALDQGFLGLDYARNFYDSDQRPLRAALLAWDGPMRIVHGRSDGLVPVAAALEHRRLVPQSELDLRASDHFLVFREPQALAQDLEAFLTRVEAGRARQRADTTSAERELAARPWDGRGVPPLEGASLLLILVLGALATLVTEDLTCLALGGLVGQGRLAFWPAAAACFVGIFVGDVLLFLLGRWLGRRALRHAPFTWFLDAGRVERSARWLERRGGWVILAARFLPGARLSTYFACGVLGTGVLRFTLWFALAALLWTPTLVALAAGVGEGLARSGLLSPGGGGPLLATLLAAWALAALLRRGATWRGRALLRATWRRARRFEYWPLWLFYLPVAGLGLLRALRGRALEFTAANPGLPHGGVVGESKRAIYEQLAAAGAPLPRMLALAAELPPVERLARARAFLEGEGVRLPLVLKPDVGQRGEGVVIVRTRERLRALLSATREDLILQEFVAGPEFGLSYARAPGAAPGRLFSIARKVLPTVVGDGRRSLERLILGADEHLPMARFLLALNAERLERVPAAGERVLLGELGTHCRGARFLAGEDLRTPALEQAVERLSARLPGVCLGRLDVRAPSDEALSRGVFTVLELNGVTSEPAHVYDPGVGLLAAWRTLLWQWRQAWELGRLQTERGARVSRPGELLRAWRDYRRLARRRLAPWRGAAPGEPPGARSAELLEHPGGSAP